MRRLVARTCDRGRIHNLRRSCFRSSVDQNELAWAAGFFDGEGWAGFERQAGRATGQPHARINQSDNAGVPFVLQRFQRAVGGCGVVGGPYQKVGRLDLYRWEVSSHRDVRTVFDLLSPWLGAIKLSQLAAASERPTRKSRLPDPVDEWRAWAAGLFDGEGSMSLLRHGTRAGYFVAEMSVTQLGRSGQPEVLRRFIGIAGAGRIYGPYLQEGASQDVYRWKCHTIEDFESVRSRLAPWQSGVKAAQIARAMSVLLAQPKLPRGNPAWGRDKTHCVHGHDYSTARIRSYVARTSGQRRRDNQMCLQCLREYARKRRETRRSAADDDRRSISEQTTRYLLK